MAEGSGLDVPITAVTVFLDGARVVRTGPVHVKPGIHRVVVGVLPAAADPASVRLAVRGRDLALLGVEVHHGYRADPLRDETARLRSEVEGLGDDVQALDDEDAAEQARLGLLDASVDHLAVPVLAAEAYLRATGTNGDIRVPTREITPAPGEQTDLGELAWELGLEGGQTATIRYRFTVEHPAQITVAGL